MSTKPSKREQKIVRAREVQELQIRGLSSIEIAEFLGISERTVWRDLKLAKQLDREEVRALNHEENLGERLTVLQGIRTKALQDYQFCPVNSTIRVGFLNTALKAEEKIIQLFLEVGAIDKVPERISIEEGNPFSDPQFRKKYLALMKEAKAKGIKIHGL